MSVKNEKVKILQFDTYLAMINNSIGSNIFKNLYVSVDGKKKDATEDGWLSCAFFVSSILFLCGYIKRPHGTVAGTIKDLEENNWKEIYEPTIGSVIVWKEGINTNGHKHIGFYIGDGFVISNDSWKKSPIKDDWKFGGKREIDKIFWKENITEK